MRNEKFISALDRAVLSDETCQRIYENITAKNTAPRPTVSKRFVAVLAAALVIVLAAGTVAAAVIISGSKKHEYTIVDMDGNIMYDSVEYTEDTDSQKAVYNEEWVKSHSSYTMLAIESDSSSAGFFGLSQSVYDYNELKALIPDDSLLQLPEYIPDGFEFSEAYIGLYLTEEEVSNAAEPEDVFISEGVVYQCYQFPESIEDNIECVTVVYTNADGEKIKFMSKLVSGFVGISTQKDVKVSTPDIDGFEKAVCTVDSERTYCAVQNSIEPVEYFTANIMGCEERAAIHGDEVIYSNSVKFDTENYVAWSESVREEELMEIKEELMKMIESVK